MKLESFNNDEHVNDEQPEHDPESESENINVKEKEKIKDHNASGRSWVSTIRFSIQSRESNELIPIPDVEEEIQTSAFSKASSTHSHHVTLPIHVHAPALKRPPSYLVSFRGSVPVLNSDHKIEHPLYKTKALLGPSLIDIFKQHPLKMVGLIFITLALGSIIIAMIFNTKNILIDNFINSIEYVCEISSFQYNNFLDNVKTIMNLLNLFPLTEYQRILEYVGKKTTLKSIDYHLFYLNSSGLLDSSNVYPNPDFYPFDGKIPLHYLPSDDTIVSFPWINSNLSAPYFIAIVRHAYIKNVWNGLFTTNLFSMLSNFSSNSNYGFKYEVNGSVVIDNTYERPYDLSYNCIFDSQNQVFLQIVGYSKNMLFLAYPYIIVLAFMSIIIPCSLLYMFKEYQKFYSLMAQFVPSEFIGLVLKGERIKEVYHGVTILFSDIVSFTKLTDNLGTDTVVTVLDELYTEYDKLVERHGVYKNDVIGDSFMCMAGCPFRNLSDEDNARKMAHLAHDMLEVTQVVAEKLNIKLEIRIGLHTGQVTACVMGTRVPHFTPIGDTVNIASRLESHGWPGYVHVSETTARLLIKYPNEFKIYERMPMINFKGKGEMRSFFVNRVVDLKIDNVTPRSNAIDHILKYTLSRQKDKVVPIHSF